MAAAALLAISLVGCSGGSADEVEDAGSASSLFEPKPVITLVVNDWTASAINVAVAEQLIERYLAHPVVPARIDDTTEIYEGLADGSLDAVLEIWPSAMSERDGRYFDRGEVEELGELGVVGKVGWFVPRYVVEEHPQLATWEGLQSSDAAALFATAETRPDGRLLGTNPDYQQHDIEIIENLGLPLQVEFSGSEAATVAALEAAHDAREPILLYWWTPTAAVGAYDLVNVTLPAPTGDCLAAAEAGTSGVDCDYPEDVLFKASSPDLAAKAPEVHRFLEAFMLTTGDQVELLMAVEIQGLTIEQAARSWIDANEDRWRPWLEASEATGEDDAGGPSDDGGGTGGPEDPEIPDDGAGE
jgi:glycine betaine/proline transport system substrate-binding protein